MSEAEAFRILDAAWELGARVFDTAEAYGSSAERLRKWIEQRGNAASVEVATKCSVGAPGTPPRALADSAHAALSRFNGIGRLVLLTHGPVGAQQWALVRALALTQGAAAGQSVYSADEVRAACELAGTTRVQVPGNVIDRRAIEARNGHAVPLDVRSVYLQGVLLEEPIAADARAPGAGRISAVVQAAAAALNTAPATLLVAVMLRALPQGDRVVIGVHSVAELGVLPPAFEMSSDTVQQFEDEVGKLAGDPVLEAVLDPRAWPAPAGG